MDLKAVNPFPFRIQQIQRNLAIEQDKGRKGIRLESLYIEGSSEDFDRLMRSPHDERMHRISHDLEKSLSVQPDRTLPACKCSWVILQRGRGF